MEKLHLTIYCYIIIQQSTIFFQVTKGKIKEWFQGVKYDQFTSGPFY